MKLLTSLTITIALVAPLPLLAQTPTPSPAAAEVQAKQELNEAARAYRERKFAEAQAHSEKALLLDPQNKTAPYFVARKPLEAFPVNSPWIEGLTSIRDI